VVVRHGGEKIPIYPGNTKVFSDSGEYKVTEEGKPDRVFFTVTFKGGRLEITGGSDGQSGDFEVSAQLV
jgi:hypothetical protein